MSHMYRMEGICYHAHSDTEVSYSHCAERKVALLRIGRMWNEQSSFPWEAS